MIQTLRLIRGAHYGSCTYLCYGRSDKKTSRGADHCPFGGGYAGSGWRRPYMTLIHMRAGAGFFSIPGDVLTASRILISHIKENMRASMHQPVVVSVDLGFAKQGRNYAADMDMPIAFIEKRRLGNDAKAEALTLIGDVKDRDVIIVDDEVDTGSSIAQAVQVVRQQGARDIYLVFVHAILSKDGAERLASLPIKQIITRIRRLSPEKIKDLEGRITVLSVAPCWAK